MGVGDTELLGREALDDGAQCLAFVDRAIAIDGVSLTVNDVTDNNGKTEFEVMLVPQTLHSTTLDNLDSGALAHVEVDQLARYVDRILRVTEK